MKTLVKSKWFVPAVVGVAALALVIWLPGIAADKRMDFGVALGTGLLAIATVWLGQAAREDAEEARAADLRPVVTVRLDKRISNDTTITLQVANIGKGAAINVLVYIQPVTDTDDPVPKKTYRFNRKLQLAAGATDDAWADTERVPVVGTGRPATWPGAVVVMTYQDVESRPFWTKDLLVQSGVGPDAEVGEGTLPPDKLVDTA